MSLCSIGNFNVFYEKHKDKFSKCKYVFFLEKSKELVKKVFVGEKLNDAERRALEAYTGVSVDTWKKLSDDFNTLDVEIPEECLDPNNIPSAI